MQQPQGVAGLPLGVDRVGAFRVERTRVARVALDGQETWVRRDAVVGRRGDVEPVRDSALDLRMQQAFLGDGGLERLRGTGEVLVSAGDHDVLLVRLADEAITANAAHLVAFTGTLSATPGHVRPGGVMRTRDLATTILAGTGTVALAAHGPPVAMEVEDHLTVAPDAIAFWSGDLHVAYQEDALPRDGVTFRGVGLLVLQPVTRPSPSV